MCRALGGGGRVVSKVLGKLSEPGRPTNLDNSWAVAPGCLDTGGSRWCDGAG